MINSLLINNFILVLIIALGIWLGFWVYFANKKGKVNKGFFLMVASILLWITFYHFASFTTQYDLSLILFRLSCGSVFAFFIAYYFFIKWFLEKEGPYNFLGKFILGYGSIFCLVSIFTNFMIPSVSTENWGAFPVFSYLGWLIFYGYSIFLTILINIMLLVNYFKFSKEKKLKVQYFLIGLFLFAGLNFIFNIALQISFQNYKFYQLGNYSLIFLIGFTAYAIVKQKLFGIKVVLTSLFVGLMGILLLINFLISETIFDYIWKGGIFILFLIFGYLLIKSVLREVERREELEKLTRQLGKANKELEKLSGAKSEFISIASHQLRAPLTAIKGYISMLIEGDFGKLPKEAKEKMGNVYQSSERLMKLIEGLLSVSRIESGKTEANLEKSSIEDLISSIVDELRIEAEKKNIYLKFKKSKKSLPKILMDKNKIRQVILNIIDNAIKYTNKGGITIKIQNPKSKIQIKISDTGEGMVKEELEKIFKSFSRGEAGRKSFVEGTGLGLYIAYKFVEMHKGKIWAESAGQSKGSQFYVELPVK